MREHGVNIPDPGPDGRLRIPTAASTGRRPRRRGRRARASCRGPDGEAGRGRGRCRRRGGGRGRAPEQGETVKRGGTLLKVAGRPVTLMYGASPMYRTLKAGDSGKDVRQLEQNLRALGYGGMTVDDEFTAATEAAVKEWQDDRELRKTGTVDAGQVVFLDGAVRVREVKAPEGKRAVRGQPVLTVAGTRRVVHVDQDLAKEGAKVSVELPGGTTVKGTIIEVGSVAESTGRGRRRRPRSASTSRSGRRDRTPGRGAGQRGAGERAARGRPVRAGGGAAGAARGRLRRRGRRPDGKAAARARGRRGVRRRAGRDQGTRHRRGSEGRGAG